MKKRTLKKAYKQLKKGYKNLIHDVISKESENAYLRLQVEQFSEKATEYSKPQNPNENLKRVCLFCGIEYIHKHNKQKYCSANCRIKAWEIKTGRKLVV